MESQLGHQKALWVHGGVEECDDHLSVQKRGAQFSDEMGQELARSVAKMELKDAVFSSSGIKRGGSSTPRRRARSSDSTGEGGSAGGSVGAGGGATGSTGSTDGWGWFDEHTMPEDVVDGPEFCHQPVQRSLSLPPPVTEPPLSVLESPLPTQVLWYSTAGQRPRQPEKERIHYEKVWRDNFEKSAVVGLRGMAHMKEKEEVPEKDFVGDIVYRGKAPFSNAVSKTFEEDIVVSRRGVSNSAAKAQQSLSRRWNSVTLQLPRFRIVRHADGTAVAEFLVVVSLQGVHHNYVTFGVWRRHSCFEALSKAIQSVDCGTSFKNATLSWQCFVSRKRWFRCLDIDYLALKCFLLERFLHDVLFESSTAGTISEFLDLQYSGPAGSGEQLVPL